MLISNIIYLSAMAALSGNGASDDYSIVEGARGPLTDFESDIRFSHIGEHRGVKVAFMDVNSPMGSPITGSITEPWSVMDLRGAYRMYEDTIPAGREYPEFAHLIAACTALDQAGEPCSLFDRSFDQRRPTLH